MILIANAIMPMALLLALGQALKLSGKFPDEAWAPIDKLVYFVLFPALIFSSITASDFSSAPILRIALVLGTSQCVLAAITFLARRDKTIEGPSFASLLQGSVRYNGFITLALSSSLYGAEGLALASLTVVALSIVANGISIWGFLTFANGGLKRGAMLRAYATNPIILACALGLAFSYSGLGLPVMLRNTVDLMGGATIALGLLTTGAGIDLSALKRTGATVIIWSLVRMMVFPALALAGCWLTGMEGAARAVVIIAASTPTATSGYILARQMGGDHRLTASLITAMTLMALVTMPFWMYLAARF